ncbi:cpsf5 [Gossypium arboreum]|uniref:Cpsf5 n=1 Tax=Gossypium arboreum TaxID=29729 RepID=A0A0B0NKU5_GOSAR|nr:cpsf5 [Gossypium arboreum]
MGDLHMGVEAEAINDSSSDNHSKRVDIYPLSCYYFGSKEAIVFKDETLSDRINRMKSNYAAYGLRTSVEAVILVELFKHPHLLLLQVRNSFFKLPGGRLRPGESGVHQTLPCEVTGESKIYRTQKSQIACSSIAPDIWTDNIGSAAVAIQVHHQHC